MKTHKMIKPSGVEVDVNDASLSYALSLDWKIVKKAEPKKAVKKKAD